MIWVFRQGLSITEWGPGCALWLRFSYQMWMPLSRCCRGQEGLVINKVLGALAFTGQILALPCSFIELNN